MENNGTPCCPLFIIAWIINNNSISDTNCHGYNCALWNFKSKQCGLIKEE